MPGTPRARARLLVIGLNPAWQQVFVMPSLRPGDVNRATRYLELASGKGMNVARALARQGHDVSLLQVLAGARGRLVAEACATHGIRSLHAWAIGETRVCTTLLGDGTATEVIAPYELRDAEAVTASLLSRLRPGDAYDAVLVCGTAPAGLADDLYGRILDRAAGPLLVWDSVAGLTVATLARINWLKVNAAEHEALRPVLAATPVQPARLVTDGAAGARLHTSSGARAARVPRLEPAINPIGAGDVATALFTD